MLARVRRWIGVLLGLVVLAEVLGFGWALVNATRRFDTTLTLLLCLLPFGPMFLNTLLNH